MNKKAFTLIEMLAIIIVLSFIILITMPVIQDMINKSKFSAAVDSAYGYKDALEKHFLSPTIEGDYELDGIYIVSGETVSGPELDPTDIYIKGDKPTSGYMRYKNNILEVACLEINEYRVVYTNEEFTSNEKNNCNINFQKDSWETIKSLLSADKTIYPIGSTKKQKMNLDGTEKEYTLRLVNVSHPSDCDRLDFSKTGCGVVIEFVNTIGAYPYYENFNSDTDINTGWAGSTLRTVLNTGQNSIYNKLPEDLKAVIIPTGPVVSSWAGSGSQVNSMDDYLYIEAPRELNITAGSGCNNATYGTSCDRASNLTRTMDFYTNSGAAKKYTALGEVTVYWSRSMNNATGAWTISTTGAASSYQNIATPYEVAPAFRILD